MDGHQFSRFPPPQQEQHQQQQQQTSAYPYNTTPYHTVQYTYPSSVPQPLLPPPPQSQPSQYFQTLPQGAPQQAVSSLQRDGRSSLPSSPGRGPGAPPPERNSPPPEFEQDLMNVLQNRAEPTEAPTRANTNANDEDDDDDDQDVIEGDEPVYQLPPPPEIEYEDEVALEKGIHAWSLEHGYELVRRASKKNAQGQLYKRYYHCSKHGRVGNDQKDKRRVHRKSNRIGCPMSLAAVSVNPHDPSGNWQIRLRKVHHNHPAVDATELAGHRRRARFGAIEKAVDGLFAINTSTKDVLKFLQRTHPEGLFKRTDVANMKLKYKKHGSCVHQADGGPSEATPQTTPSVAQKGLPSACNQCRGRKSQCDSQRPKCGSCMTDGSACAYDHAPNLNLLQQQPLPPAQAPTPRTQQHVTPGSSASSRPQRQATAGAPNADAMQIDDTSLSFGVLDRNGSDISNTPGHTTSQAAQAQGVFAAIAAFQQEHIRPPRLDLNSSAVEVLASSTCGNGDSYKHAIPHAFSIGGDWTRYKEAFESAAVKENCVDVLLGHKKEPEKPKPANGEAGVEVEVHNEYIKQLAIFKRRNDMLKLGFRETLSPALWSRVKLLPDATEIWTWVDDMCCPRGSDQAYARFNEIQSVTLAGCGGNLDNYIHTLELKWMDFNGLATTHESRRMPSQLNMSAAEVLKRKVAGNGTFPEEMLCFLFLRNLGAQHQNLATNLCKKNNIGGFGSGERCGFKDLWLQVKRTLER